jgi:hypothetical protein
MTRGIRFKGEEDALGVAISFFVVQFYSDLLERMPPTNTMKYYMLGEGKGEFQ